MAAIMSLLTVLIVDDIGLGYGLQSFHEFMLGINPRGDRYDIVLDVLLDSSHLLGYH
jgi:hypothetical protein